MRGPDFWLLLALLLLPAPDRVWAGAYPWLRADPGRSIVSAIAPPPGHERSELPDGSFGRWLHGLPLRGPGTPVFLFDGRRKANQRAHHAVLDLDTGPRDLQQCADAVIRLRAEYLYARGDLPAIRFRFTSADDAPFERWAEGWRPRVEGNEVGWEKSAGRDASYESFRRYLDTVFAYAGTDSLSRELAPVPDAGAVEAGDVFIQGGFPGHAVLVVDTARNPCTGEKVFLLAQGFMPAQDVHVLRNPGEPGLSPWYRVPAADGELVTPEWTFRAGDLRRFPCSPAVPEDPASPWK